MSWRSLLPWRMHFILNVEIIFWLFLEIWANGWYFRHWLVQLHSNIVPRCRDDRFLFALTFFKMDISWDLLDRSLFWHFLRLFKANWTLVFIFLENFVPRNFTLIRTLFFLEWELGVFLWPFIFWAWNLLNFLRVRFLIWLKNKRLSRFSFVY